MPEIRYQDHTDDVAEKLRLLQAAHASGRREVALSLAESIRETIRFERQVEGDRGAEHVGAGEFAPVDDLPRPWADWARGWSYAAPLTLFETVGLARTREPVEIRLGIRADQASDPARELRIARVEAEAGLLHEIPCQVSVVARAGRDWRCRLTILADVPQHGQSTYLIFSGNPNAELTDYVTDLRVQGEGYDLRIANHHYVAHLSRQMGQLERLVSRREHGLELYAGGKGHGEPPGIDWAHDYVDQGGFQKLRMRNWPECPDYEVETGPLFVRVRRWGFPYSPVHPVFTPSRIHIDQTYTFYAGLPYFSKEGSMEAIKEVAIEAMRDDEWVFSGYSFTETVWIDRAGKLREGPVPPEDAQDLWGVGFYHRDSRDAFVALWLEHHAEGFDAIGHNGTPTLHYPGHGQLWSRYPARHARLAAGTAFRQKNAYLLLAYPESDPGRPIEELRHRLLHPVELRADGLPRADRPRAVGALARVGETEDSAPLKPAIWQALHLVRDEQLYTAEASIVDLGYVDDVRLRHGVAHVVVTMPHRGRPVHDFLVSQGGGRVSEGIRERLLKVRGVRDVVVDLTWDPPWTVARLTDTGRRALGLTDA